MAVTADSVIIELIARFDKFKAESREAATSFERSIRSMEGAGNRLNATFRSIGAGIAALGIAQLSRALIGTAADFQKLQAQLEVATGGTAQAAAAFANLKDLAAQTPFSLKEVTSAFILLKNLGLDPSTQAIVAYGNTAAALGKTLDQVVQAVADATVGEFERLKEFGIKASAEGNKVAFTFRGVTTTVGKNADEIQKFLQNIGNTDFAGSLEKQSQTLAGAFSNLGDNIDQLVNRFGEGGFAGAVLEATRALSENASSAGELADELGALAGDAINAGADVIGAFKDTDNAGVEMVRSIRAAFATLADLKTSFDPLLDGASSVFDALGIKLFSFEESLRATLRELDAINNFVPGLVLGERPSNLLGQYDTNRARIDAEARDRELNRRFPLPAFGGASGSGGGGGGGGRGNGSGGPRGSGGGASSLSPAQQRAFANDIEDAGLGVSASQAIADLDLIAAKYGEVKTIAVDLSNADIIDQQAIDAAERFSKNLSDGLALAIINGQSLGDALVNSLKAAAAELVSSGLLSLLTGAIGGGTGGIGGILAGVFGGFRANGGPVTGNRPYVVGERGPELFVPSANGNIRPNGSFGGGSGMTVNQSFSISLAGNAATKEDAAAFARIAYEQSMMAFRQSQQFGVPSL